MVDFDDAAALVDAVSIVAVVAVHAVSIIVVGCVDVFFAVAILVPVVCWWCAGGVLVMSVLVLGSLP